ncbi:MAG TPA: tannase/feruloyl esterase family alpha/beta hydrolase [Steroidobacteraceae bacterium]|nr:tannase/feruloyl esterase family alpha/beta hydrolase [Steroidobacteraceae bacterium]
MFAQASQTRLGLDRWIATASLTAVDIAERCTVGALQKAVAAIEGAEVVSVTINRSGVFKPPQPHWSPNFAPVPDRIPELPVYCEVLVHQRTPGGHVAEVLIWVPFAWNRRFLATGGMGSVTGPVWFELPAVRTLTMPVALRNGFATAATDAGNRDTRFFEWPLDRSTGRLDWELLRNWSYRSTHDMAVVAKAVIEGLHGCPPDYSYYGGCSGGGRQGLASVLHHPGDFDGVWAADPALNWTALWPAALWPAMVMKEMDNVLSPEKLEAFRAAAVEACDGTDGPRDGIIGLAELRDFDPRTIIGRQTAAGKISAVDAEVMRKCWDGPRHASGERIWYGLPPGTNSWGPEGIWSSVEVDGKLIPVAQAAESYFRWVSEDPNLDWQTLSFAQFETLTELGMRKFAEFAVNEADLSGLRECAGKLIISQGLNDGVVMSAGVIDYYRRVIGWAGGVGMAQAVARLFVTDGDIHGSIAGPGPGLTKAAAMTALMDWVENDKPPQAIVAERIDIATGNVVESRPVYCYPAGGR